MSKIENAAQLEEWFKSEGVKRLQALAKKKPELHPLEASNIVMEELLAEREKAMGMRNIKINKDENGMPINISFEKEH